MIVTKRHVRYLRATDWEQANLLYASYQLCIMIVKSHASEINRVKQVILHSKPAKNRVYYSIADPDPGVGAFWPLDPGTGMGRKSASGSGIGDEQPGSYLRA